MQFDLVDISLFVNIAETSSLTRGAELSHLCPSAASKRIKNIEHKIGTDLLYRTATGVRLTPAGRAFHDHSRILLQGMEDLQRDMRFYSDSPDSEGLKGTIRISAGNALVSEFLPAVLRKYSAIYPNVNVEVRSQLCPEIAHEVSTGIADIGIYVGALPAADAQVLPFGRYHMVLITSRNHSFAQEKRGAISFSDTLEFDYITLPEDSASHAALKRAAEIAGKPLKVRFQLPTFDDLRHMVDANLGIAVVPEFIVRNLADTTGIHVMRLTDSWVVCDMWICIRKGSPSHIVKDFADLLINDARTTFQT